MKRKINIKNRMKIILIFTFCIINLILYSQDKVETGKPTVIIKTSAECEMCKERIETKLNYTKGIVFAELDHKTHDLTVKYKAEKITLDSIKNILSELGYDADDVKANIEAQKLLPECCQPGGMKHH